MRAMVFREQQARRVHIAAGNVGMDVDRTGHDDLAGHVEHMIGRLALRRVDDTRIANPEVAHAVPSIGGIDDMAAGQAYQHASFPFRCSLIWPMTSATRGASLAALAGVVAKVVISRAHSIES